MRKYLPLLVVFVVAFGLRFLYLGQVPKGLNWDEAAYAYNSFSLLQTGRDEWNQPWPLLLKSFGEYKPALLSYLMMPALWLAPGSSTAVRSVNAILGTLAVGATYIFIFRLSKNRTLALFAAFSLAVTPWHIHFSRAAFDPGLAHAFLLIGLALLVGKKSWQWWSGVFLLGLSMYAYSAERIFIPILLGGLVWWWQQGQEKIKQRIWPVVAIFIVAVVWIGATSFGSAGARARSVSWLGKGTIQIEAQSAAIYADQIQFPILKLFHHPVFILLNQVSRQYSLYWRPDFLFFKDGGVNASPILGFPSRGNVLEIMAPFFVLGLLVALSKPKAVHTVFLFWLLIAPLPGALTTDGPHPGRGLILLPAVNYFIALGVVWLAEKIARVGKKPILEKLVLAGSWLIFSIATVSFAIDYFTFFPEQSEWSWQGEFEDVSRWFATKPEGEKTFFTHSVDNHALLFYAWYAQIDPRLIQAGVHAGSPEFHLAQFRDTQVVAENETARACALLQPRSWVVLTPAESEMLLTEPTARFTFYRRVDPKQEAFRVYDTDSLSAEDVAWSQAKCSGLVPNW